MKWLDKNYICCQICRFRQILLKIIQMVHYHVTASCICVMNHRLFFLVTDILKIGIQVSIFNQTISNKPDNRSLSFRVDLFYFGTSFENVIGFESHFISNCNLLAVRQVKKCHRTNCFYRGRNRNFFHITILKCPRPNFVDCFSLYLLWHRNYIFLANIGFNANLILNNIILKRDVRFRPRLYLPLLSLH